MNNETLPHILVAFLTSAAIGFLIGVERERNPSAKAGVRTFPLIALFGTLAAVLAEMGDTPWLIAAGLLLVGLAIISAYHNAPPETAPGGVELAEDIALDLFLIASFPHLDIAVAAELVMTLGSLADD